jgi:hypothetical protein
MGKFDIRIDQSGVNFFIDTNCNPAFGPKSWMGLYRRSLICTDFFLRNPETPEPQHRARRAGKESAALCS